MRQAALPQAASRRASVEHHHFVEAKEGRSHSAAFRPWMDAPDLQGRSLGALGTALAAARATALGASARSPITCSNITGCSSCAALSLDGQPDRRRHSLGARFWVAALGAVLGAGHALAGEQHKAVVAPAGRRGGGGGEAGHGATGGDTCESRAGWGRRRSAGSVHACLPLPRSLPGCRACARSLVALRGVAVAAQARVLVVALLAGSIPHHTILQQQGTGGHF